jgi:hypothetical protein
VPRKRRKAAVTATKERAGWSFLIGSLIGFGVLTLIAAAC